MGVTLTALGATLEATIVDDNFGELEKLLISRLEQSDFASVFSRYHILRYTGHRLMSATSFANPRFDALLANQAKFDVTIRYGINTSPEWGGSGVADAMQTFELLGFPGNTFYFDWQEEGYSEGDIASIGWPPTGWPYNRYPANACFSPWLTLPGAALKVYADEPCVAVVSGSAFGSSNFTPVGALSNYGYIRIGENMNYRQFYPLRVALIVDTNPVVYEDEFANTNPNIEGDFCSFQFIEQRAFYCAQRQMHKLAGEVALKGRRYYNFSFKYKYGGIFGYAIDDGENNQWVTGFWESLFPSEGGFNENPDWRDSIEDWMEDWTVAPADAAALALLVETFLSVRPYVCLWESGATHVEFHYGRSTAYVSEYDDPEFDEVPDGG